MPDSSTRPCGFSDLASARGGYRRRRAALSLLAGLAALSLTGCTAAPMDAASAASDGAKQGDAGRAQGSEAVSAPDFTASPRGYVAVVFLNRSRTLAQPIVTTVYAGQPRITWQHAVAPGTWDSLLIECGVSEIELVGVVPIDLERNVARRQVDFDGAPLRAAEDFACGSMIVVEIDDAGESVRLAASVVPEFSPQAEVPDTSPLAPGEDSGLVLLLPRSASGIPMSATVCWESAEGLVYVSRWEFEGAAPRFATLAECPVARVGWGDATDAQAPGARVGADRTPLAAPAPLAPKGGLCGQAVTLAVNGDSANPSEMTLSVRASSSGAGVEAGEIDLFGNIRALLEREGFAGRLSGSNALENPFPRGQ